MAKVEFDGDGAAVDAAELAAGLGLAAEAVPGLLRAGRITSRFERGEGEDAGRSRLSFYYASRRLRLIVDAAGTILQRSSIDFGDRPLPDKLRRTGD